MESSSIGTEAFENHFPYSAVTSIEKIYNPSFSAKRHVYSGAWIPLVLLQRGFEQYEYGCDDDEPDGEGSSVLLPISANRIWRPWRQS